MANSISGATKNLGGSIIAGVTVNCYNYANGQQGTLAGTATSDGSGNYSITGLAPGDYVLTASSVGWVFSVTLGFLIVSTDVSGADFNATNNAIFGFSTYKSSIQGASGVASMTLTTVPLTVNQPVMIMVRGGTSITSVSDNVSGSNVYNLLYTVTDAGGIVNKFYLCIPAVGSGSATITFNFSPNTTFTAIHCWIMQNAITGTWGLVNFSSNSSGASVTTIDTNSFSTITAISFIGASANSNSGATTNSTVRGMLTASDNAGANFSQGAGHVTQYGLASGTVGFTFTGSSTGGTTVAAGVWGYLSNGIRGNCGVPNATVSYSFSSGRSGSVTSDITGAYYIPYLVLSDLAVCTITPTKSNMTFSPTNNTVTPSSLTADSTGPTFTASTTITVGPTFSATSDTIICSWTTNGSCDSKAFAGVAYPAVDNAIPADETSHVAVITGLSASTTYSVTVQSGTTQSAPQNVTTATYPTRYLINGVSAIGTSNAAASSQGDTTFDFQADDGIDYITIDDGVGFSGGTSSNANLNKITGTSPFTGSQINTLIGFGGFNTYDGQDDPVTSGSGSTKKFGGGPLSIAGKMMLFMLRQNNTQFYQYRGIIMTSADHGVSWGNWQNPGVYNANGIQASPLIAYTWNSSTIGWTSPVRYAADNGTLGYSVAGNGFDGGNAYIYFLLNAQNDNSKFGPAMARIPRRALVMGLFTTGLITPYTLPIQYWHGPASPSILDFIKDNNWTSTFSGATQIYSPPDGKNSLIWPVITFIPGINSYLLTAASSNWVFASAPTPAGPWTTQYNGAQPSGFSDLNSPCPYHPDVIANAATSNLSIRLLHSAQPGAHYNYRITSGTTFTVSPAPVPPPSLGVAFDILFRGKLYVTRVVSGL